MLAQGDILVATTGVFKGDKGDVSPASPLHFGEERRVQVWLGSFRPRGSIFGRISTTDVTLVDVEPFRLASLSSLAQAHLKSCARKALGVS